MSKNVIFCFSGTGNCLDIAKNIARGLGDTDIVMMRRAPAVRDVHEAERVGFVFPCYAGGLPGDVEKYVRSLFIGAKAYTFGVVSYAGYPGVGLAKINEIVPLSYHAGISHQSACNDQEGADSYTLTARANNTVYCRWLHNRHSWQQMVL